MYNSIKRCMMKIFDKINFREPKYMLPAVLYIPLLVASYFIFDLFHTETAEIPDKTLQTTEFLNPDLPDARLKGGDGIGSKYENMAKSWGKIQDYSAVDNIERCGSANCRCQDTRARSSRGTGESPCRSKVERTQ